MKGEEAAHVAAERAYVELRDRLSSGTLLPGQRLVEADLVESLNVSRAVVRATLTRLAYEGLVEKEPNRGARVRRVSEAEAVEITQARAVLEALVAREAAVHATADDLDAMRALIEDMHTLLAENDLIAYSECNSKLHRRIIAASGHAVAQRLITNLRAQMVRFQYRTILVPGRPAESVKEHAALVDAIAARDPDRAEQAMRYHLAHVGENLVKIKDMSAAEAVL